MAECFTPNNAGTGTSIIYSYGSQQSYPGTAQWSTSGYENCPVVFVAVNVNTYVMSQVIPVGYSWASNAVTAELCRVRPRIAVVYLLHAHIAS